MKRLLLLGASILTGAAALPTPAWAQDTVELGRIFLTPEQRRLLDVRRRNPQRFDAELPADLLPGRPPASERVVMNGVIRRGQKPPLIWINGARAELLPGHGVRLQRGPDTENRVTVSAGRRGRSGAVMQLKPGQVWDLQSGRVSECAACGVLVPPPAEPAASDTAAIESKNPALAAAASTDSALVGAPAP